MAENEWTTCVSTQDGSTFYRNKSTGETMTRFGPQNSGSQSDDQQPPPTNLGGVLTSPVKNEVNAAPEDAVDEDLLEDDLGDDNLSVIDQEMRAS